MPAQGQDQEAEIFGGRSRKGGLTPLRFSAWDGLLSLIAICNDASAQRSGSMAVSTEQAQLQLGPSFSQSLSAPQDEVETWTGASLIPISAVASAASCHDIRRPP